VAPKDAVLGAHAWAYMRRDSGYRAAWAAQAAPPRFEDADIPVRLQTEADLLAEAEWALLAWEDPGAEAWRSPFWSGVPMLIGTGGAPIQLAYCWSHARRRLREIYDNSGSEIAAEDLRRIAELYVIEADIRGSPPEQRLAERQAQSAPLVQAFGDWLKQQRARVSPKSRLGEKLVYIARHWGDLRLFLADGRVEMGSNAVENLARPIALTRKNTLFAGHDEGAVAWVRISSLTQTARLNGVEPFAWLKVALEAIAAGHPNDRIDDLLPWNFASSSS